MTGVRRVIDLNADVGEGSPHDADLMPLISSANIAAGWHAGSQAVTAATVRLAVERGVAVGAHPGHPDREHFGRRPLPIAPDEAASIIDTQIAIVATAAGDALHHVKLHGGLYHQVGHDAALAEAVASMLAGRWPRLVVYAEAGSLFADRARSRGLAVAAEGFLDRGYAANGRLLPRGEPGATITDPAEAAALAVRLVMEGRVHGADGVAIPLAPATLCLHGDSPQAVERARAVRAALAEAGIGIAASPMCFSR